MPHITNKSELKKQTPKQALNEKKLSVIIDYCGRFPNSSHRSLSMAIYKAYPLLWNSTEAIRMAVNTFRDTRHKGRPKTTRITDVGLPAYDPKNRFDIPQSASQERKPFKLPYANNNILLISDLHIPYHDVDAINTALAYGMDNECNTIIINGDLLDFHNQSKFEPDPTKRDTKYEFDTTIAFLEVLRKHFPSQEIIFIEGNHDERYSKWLMRKARRYSMTLIIQWLKDCNLAGLRYATLTAIRL